ncbi:MAG: ABC transporter ATP-binding protein [Candidatus Puniceispirillaceae bacterium]|jgi:lipoprotein-releasing system ATP-binding protein|nr:ABC transporter ATP-binding protein [Pseudomonadota bacterium]
MNNIPPLRLENLSRHFSQGGRRIDVLNQANLELYSGQMTALVGPSGAGKTTLLNLAGLLEVPDEGEVIIAGQNTSGLSERRRTLLRKKHIGLVFQFHRLFAEFSALENIVIPQMIGGLKRKTAEERAEALLAMVGLSDRLHHRPGLLSGGEQQRVAIARSVANAPDILLADEPTGNLDPQTADSVFQALEKIVTGTQTAALIVTHNLQLADRMHRRLAIQNGQVAEIG